MRLALFSFTLTLIFFAACNERRATDPTPGPSPTGLDLPPAPRVLYPEHKAIQSSVFWVGEGESEDNGEISNVPNCWQNDWVKHHGCADSEDEACSDSVENPFYVALPYTDFKNGKRKSNVSEIPWWNSKTWLPKESAIKNRWVQVSFGQAVCFAQVEDCGPYQEDDTAYVFGSAQPKNKKDLKAGIDLSPALAKCLGVHNHRVDWRFVEVEDVPVGPWKQKITSSQIDWE